MNIPKMDMCKFDYMPYEEIVKKAQWEHAVKSNQKTLPQILEIYNVCIGCSINNGSDNAAPVNIYEEMGKKLMKIYGVKQLLRMIWRE
ncbi:hypothetical protein ABK905_10570 [Acerihabitans sp. KWT182]|uniref:Uncharacterized protein n=1 Tax=Acerihabitans sp. KWT182 TaxID=3157919 RepID=A0AAU7QE17_9GAMM